MPSSAFFAVLRDVAKLASTAADDLAAQSVKLSAAADDVAALTGKAAAKTAGIAGDDLAVGAAQVGGVSPARELPVVRRIGLASLLNKAWLAVLLLVVSALYPPAITAALVLGGLYLAYEGAEGLLERFHPPALDEEFKPMSEDEKVKGAIRTDLILSLEILVIALAATGDAPLAYKAVVLGAIAVLMTVFVYGLIALLIRLDDIGLALARGASGLQKAIGEKLVHATPLILKALGPIGMVAMFLVAGGIFTHLAHVRYSHWTLNLLGDAAVGVLIGLALAGLHSLALNVKKKATAVA